MVSNKVIKDFDAAGLPKTRVEVFKDVLKLRFGVFLKIGLILFLSFIPLIVLGIFEDSGLAMLYNQYTNGTILDDVYKANVASVKIRFSILKIFSFMIISIALAGVVKIIKYLIWAEPVFFKQDLINGINENSKSFIAISFLFGICNLVTTFTYYGFDDKIVFSGILTAIKYLIIVPVLLLSLALTVIYKMSFLDKIQNALFLFIKTLPLTLLATLFVVIFPLINLVGHLLIKYLILILCVISMFVFP